MKEGLLLTGVKQFPVKARHATFIDEKGINLSTSGSFCLLT